MLMYVYAYYLCLSMLNIRSKFGKNYKGGTVCVNHTLFALANRRPRNSLWDRKPSPRNSKKKKENPHHPHVTKTLTPTCHPMHPVPIHAGTSSSMSMLGSAYRDGNHLARRLPPPGCPQTPPHFATSACRRLSPSIFLMLLAVDPAPLGWGICCTEVSFSWTTR